MSDDADGPWQVVQGRRSKSMLRTRSHPQTPIAPSSRKPITLPFAPSQSDCSVEKRLQIGLYCPFPGCTTYEYQEAKLAQHCNRTHDMDAAAVGDDLLLQSNLKSCGIKWCRECESIHSMRSFDKHECIKKSKRAPVLRNRSTTVALTLDHVRSCRNTTEQKEEKKDEVMLPMKLPSPPPAAPCASFSSSSSSSPSPISSSFSHISFPTPQMIANHGRLLRDTPPALRVFVASVAANRLKAVAEAIQLGMDVVPALARFLQLPSIVLMKTSHIRHRRIAQHIRSCQKILAQSSSSSLQLIPSSSPITSTSSSSLCPNLSRAIAFVQEGEVKRAVQSMQHSEPPADLSNPKLAAKIISLHPPSLPIPAPTLPSDSPFFSYEPESKEFKNMVKAANTGASPGPSGWSGKHLFHLLRNETCRRYLAILCSAIRNGTLSSAARAYLTASSLTALIKPGSTPNNESLRPIAVGEVLYRMVVKDAARQAASTAAALLQPIQFGVGVPSGCEKIIHEIQSRLEDENKKNVGLSIDIKNAFNSIHRSEMMKALFSYPTLSSLFRISHWSYSTPSLLFVRTNDNVTTIPDLASSRGTRQGCPLAMLLFCIGIQTAFNKAATAAPDSVQLALADDYTIIGPADSVKSVYNSFKVEAEKLGLEIQAQKSKLLFFHSHSTSNIDLTPIRALSSMIGCPLITDATIILGTAVGVDRKKIKDLTLQQLNISDSFFKSIINPKLPVQVAIRRSWCTGCKLTFGTLADRGARGCHPWSVIHIRTGHTYEMSVLQSAGWMAFVPTRGM